MAPATSACSSAEVRWLQWCSRNQCHSRSTGLSSGEYGGRNSGVIRRGHRSLCEQCQPAPSRIITACSRRRSLLAAASRNACVVSVFTSRYGMAIDQPVAGSTAANTRIDFRPCWRTTVGRDPLIARQGGPLTEASAVACGLVPRDHAPLRCRRHDPCTPNAARRLGYGRRCQRFPASPDPATPTTPSEADPAGSRRIPWRSSGRACAGRRDSVR